MSAFSTKLSYQRSSSWSPWDAGRKREAEGWQVDGIAELPNKQLCQYLAFPPESVMLLSGPGKSPASPIRPHRARSANGSSKNTWSIPSWTGLKLPSPKSDRGVRKPCVTPSLAPPWLVLNAPVDPKVWEKKPRAAAAHSCSIYRVCGTLAAPNVYFLSKAWPSRSSHSQGCTRTFGALTEDPIGPKIQEIREMTSIVPTLRIQWFTQDSQRDRVHTHTHTRGPSAGPHRGVTSPMNHVEWFKCRLDRKVESLPDRAPVWKAASASRV